MGYRTFVSMKIALIGTGDVAMGYATRYAEAGHEVLMAWRDGEEPELTPALAESGQVYVCSIEEAAEQADFIVIATPPKDVREVAYWLGDIRRKVIIDATPNIHTSMEEQVTTVCAIKAITGSPHVIKVFSTRGYENMLEPFFKHSHVQLIMVGESKKAKEVVKILTEGMGVDHFFDMGGNDAIPLFNEMTKGWRKLALSQGRVVSPAEPARI